MQRRIDTSALPGRLVVLDYAAAFAHERQALELWRQLGDRLGQAWALDELGMVHQETGGVSSGRRLP